MVVGAVARDDARAEEDAGTDAARLGGVHPMPEFRESVTDRVWTDRGRRLSPKVPAHLRPAEAFQAREAELVAGLPRTAAWFPRGPASDVCNCHGWVFTGGRYWLDPEDVEAILADNGYAPVAAPRPGDLAVYRHEGAIAHTAVVRAVGPDIPVLVEGKWWHLGVFLHEADATTYCKEAAYYRSPRAGHLLAGLSGPGGQNPSTNPHP